MPARNEGMGGRRVQPPGQGEAPGKGPQAAHGHEVPEAPDIHPQGIPGQDGQKHIIGHGENRHRAHEHQDKLQLPTIQQVIKEFPPGLEKWLPGRGLGRRQLHEDEGQEHCQEAGGVQEEAVGHAHQRR